MSTSISVCVNGQKCTISDAGFGHDWEVRGLKDYRYSSHRLLDTLGHVVMELGEKEIGSYLLELSDTKISRPFSTYSMDYREKTWTISDAEEAFSRFLKYDEFFPFGVPLSYFYNDDHDEYEDLDDLAKIQNKIDEMVGWKLDWNRHIDRQHMCVTVECRWGQVEPQWHMSFRNPTLLQYSFDLDKMRKEIKEEEARREEYYEKLAQLQEEYGIYE